MKKTNWDEYYKSVGDSPRTLLITAATYLKNKNQALDLGAGNLRDTKYMLKQKFKHIDVVDKQKEILKYSKNMDKSVKIYITSFNNFEFTKKYDLINAQYAFPFMKKEEFNTLFKKLVKSLNNDGIITGQFFGNRDSWKNNRDMNFMDMKSAKNMLKDLEIIIFTEEEKDAITALGEAKHWHVFHFIVKKS